MRLPSPPHVESSGPGRSPAFCVPSPPRRQAWAARPPVGPLLPRPAQGVSTGRRWDPTAPRGPGRAYARAPGGLGRTPCPPVALTPAHPHGTLAASSEVCPSRRIHSGRRRPCPAWPSPGGGFRGSARGAAASLPSPRTSLSRTHGPTHSPQPTGKALCPRGAVFVPHPLPSLRVRHWAVTRRGEPSGLETPPGSGFRSSVSGEREHSPLPVGCPGGTPGR